MSGVLKRLEFIASLIPEGAMALTSGDYQVTYDELLDEVRQRIRWLLEIKSKVVALYSGNTVEWIFIDLACQELGLVFIPLPTFFSTSQIQGCLRRAGVDTLLSDKRELPDFIDSQYSSAPYVKRLASINAIHVLRNANSQGMDLPLATQKITFTSGSTGNPKGVCLSTEHQWRVAQSLADTIGIRYPKHLCLLPLSTLLENIAGVYTPLACGGEVVIPSDHERGMLGSSGIDEQVLLCCINRIKPHSLILVPQLLTLLVQACLKGWQSPETIQFIAVGGGKVSPQLIQQARQLGLPVYQGYGLSECGSVVALNTPDDDCIDSVGRVLPHCEVTIENNEVVATGAVHLGYMEDSSTWYPEKIHTGDVGRLQDGFLSIDGRRKNILISSFGRNISPEWVESVLMEKPLFSHCVVFGDAKPFVVALVTAPISVDDDVIVSWIKTCNQKLPDYARIGNWLRITDREIQPYITANGRPQREQVKSDFDERISRLYQNDDSVSFQFKETQINSKYQQ